MFHSADILITSLVNDQAVPYDVAEEYGVDLYGPIYRAFQRAITSRRIEREQLIAASMTTFARGTMLTELLHAAGENATVTTGWDKAHEESAIHVG